MSDNLSDAEIEQMLSEACLEKKAREFLKGGDVSGFVTWSNTLTRMELGHVVMYLGLLIDWAEIDQCPPFGFTEQ